MKSKPSSVYEHRFAFYEKHGDGPFRCHLCGATVSWSNMHVDHLDEDRANNDISNLAPSCMRCNIGRAREKAAERRNAIIGRWIEFGGERLLLKQWAERAGLTGNGLAYRIGSGWPLARALTVPPRRPRA